MKIKDTIGIDCSKLTLDACIHSSQGFEVFKNEKKDFNKMLNWAFKNSLFAKEEILFVFEHTGLYSYGLSMFLTEQEIPFLLVPGLAIKKSLGITRGKDDKVDAAKIALYGYRLRDEIEPYELPSEDTMALKRLLSLRDRLVKQRAGYKASLKEQKRVLLKSDNKILLETQEKMIVYLSQQIKRIEKQMSTIIKDNKGLDQIYKLITSVKGVGQQTALYLIAFTDGFTKFKNARKFASFCGIAPFPNRSGTSVMGKTKVSHLANKKIKSLLDMCAKSAVQYSLEMKIFYQRRIEQGKNKMSTINIVRNKLLGRIFAVVHRGTPYVDMMKYAA